MSNWKGNPVWRYRGVVIFLSFEYFHCELCDFKCDIMNGMYPHIRAKHKAGTAGVRHWTQPIEYMTEQEREEFSKKSEEHVV